MVNMSEEFKRLNRELVYKGSIIDFYKDTVLVPNGNTVHWDFIGHKGAAAVVPVLPDGRIGFKCYLPSRTGIVFKKI